MMEHKGKRKWGNTRPLGLKMEQRERGAGRENVGGRLGEGKVIKGEREGEGKK